MLQIKYLGSVKMLSVDYDLLIESLIKISMSIKNMNPYVSNIFLFGSFSKGNYTPESDVDVLIIVKKAALPFLERRDVFIDFFKDIPFDVNVMVYTKEEIRKIRNMENSFIRKIMGEALEL